MLQNCEENAASLQQYPNLQHSSNAPHGLQPEQRLSLSPRPLYGAYTDVHLNQGKCQSATLRNRDGEGETLFLSVFKRSFLRLRFRWRHRRRNENLSQRAHRNRFSNIVIFALRRTTRQDGIGATNWFMAEGATKRYSLEWFVDCVSGMPMCLYYIEVSEKAAHKKNTPNTHT